MRKLTNAILIASLATATACAGTCGDIESDDDAREGADIGIPENENGSDGGMNEKSADGGVDLGPSDSGDEVGFDQPRCGDGVKDPFETCDDGNRMDGDYCSADCSRTIGECGDGVIQNNESCDDSNNDDGDYCSADCTTITGECGDGMQQSNETCDDGNTSDGDYCSGDCMTITGECGDGTQQSNETCDDGQTTDCVSTHDGGDGVCVATGTCSSGYALDGNGNCVSNNTTGLSVPCSLGSGYAVFKFHYDSGSTSARIDVWDASCSYSFAPNSACNVREVTRSFGGDVERTSQGYPVATSSDYIRVRYSVAGLNFSTATLCVQARSYATSSSTNIRAWSPIYLDVAYGPVDNDFVYDWYPIDWSNHLSPSDSPSLTAIQLYAYQGSNSLAVKAVELCVE